MNISRRDFSRLAALGAGAQLLPNIPVLGAERKVGYCILGLGRISMQHFMPAVKTSSKSRVTALVSGHRDKAERMAAEYGVPASSIYNYENYDTIAQNPEIDAVYIALPNGMHAEYTIRGAKAGKHVLCEKPMATTVEDCRAMIQACASAKKKLMIALSLPVRAGKFARGAIDSRRKTGLHPSNPKRIRLSHRAERMAAG